MQLKTIFNRVTDYKPFVVEHAALTENSFGAPMIEPSITSRKRICRVAVTVKKKRRYPSFKTVHSDRSHLSSYSRRADTDSHPLLQIQLDPG